MNVMDNMMKMMEQYSHQLEETVEIRKKQLEEEKKKTELLLYRMLPRFQSSHSCHLCAAI